MIRISNIKVAAQKDQKKVLEQEICRMHRIKSLAQSSYHNVKKTTSVLQSRNVMQSRYLGIKNSQIALW